ncbi:MAG: hypothetical protein Q7T82_16250, partial [Armatimonadota bacterium]|nr:hypothetical protein [Armatimonadota bacterium]
GEELGVDRPRTVDLLEQVVVVILEKGCVPLFHDAWLLDSSENPQTRGAQIDREISGHGDRTAEIILDSIGKKQIPRCSQ